MFGDSNPFPFQFGGPPSRIDRVYRALKDLVGKNGSSDDDESIESYWRRAKAEALACLETFDERAALQAFPNVATDHISLFEEVLGLDPDETRSYQERRNQIVPLHTGSTRAWTAALQADVQEIDERMTILSRPWVNSTVTQHGQLFERFTPVAGKEYDPSGTRISTQFPNANDKNQAIVFYDIGNGAAPSRENLRRTESARKKVRAALSSWCTIHIVYAIGITLDSSLLDATGFGT